MGPLIPDHKGCGSSESDEDGNERHDRFRSERFSEDNIKPVTKNSDRFASYSTNDSSSRRIRERSPTRYYRPREATTTLLPSRDSNRSTNDRKVNEKLDNQTTSRKSDKHIKKQNETDKKEVELDTKSSKKTLSAILKNFDKNTESTRHKSPEINFAIGPELPVHLMVRLKQDTQTVKLNKNSSSQEIVTNTVCDKLSNDKITEDACKHSAPDQSSHLTAISNKELELIEIPLLPQSKTTLNEVTLENTTISSSEVNMNISIDKNELVVTDRSQKSLSLSSDKNSDIYGPVLPPPVKNESYGPILPPGLRKENIQGPRVPTGMTVDQLDSLTKEESEDEEMVGPLPEGKTNLTQFQLDLRASQIKREMEAEKFGTSVDTNKREEWMLELPPGKAANLGLGPRSFRMREAPDMSDRSSWTDTPGDKIRKVEQALIGKPQGIDTEELKRTALIKERDKAMSKLSQKSRGRDRLQTLLEIHQKKMKKKKKKEEKEGKKKERRPFDRNIDLQVNRFDDAQKKAIFKKAQLLDTRFSSGESKYL